MTAFLMRFLGGALLKRVFGFLGGFGIRDWLIVIAVIAIVILGWQYKLGQDARADVRVLEQQLEQERADFVRELEASEQENERARARHARELMSVADEFAVERDRLLSLTQQMQAIEDAPDEDDAPVAPVLKNFLEMMP